ncbi:DUF4251 domain-containing protein [Psychroserpens sp.]|jgi:hypothetical protein|uniref:DUF4251 domain-containing protein n=1 Tax=Psychroserpens sp. TaxID=2020870 RepID=UPI0039E48A5C
MKRHSVILLLVAFTVLSCSTTKIVATPQQILILDDIVKEQSFVIVSDWALPQSTGSLLTLQNAGLLAAGDSANSINLIGNANELKINKNIVSSKLPYFGEVLTNTGYNGSDNSISFDGEMKDYRVIKNEKGSYTIRFDARSNSEKFDVIIHLFSDLKSEIILKGAKRFPIRYTGVVSSISEETE